VRLLAFFLTLVLSLSLMPTLRPGGSGAAAQTLANGVTLVGDFRGSGAQQIATLYDPNDDFGLRIVVLERGADGKFTHTAWFLGKANQFDLSRMKAVAVDLNGDKKTDLAVLYNDGNLAVRMLVWLSTGSGFTYTGDGGWWRHASFDWNRAGGLLAGAWDSTPRTGLLIPYQLDNSRLTFLYLIATGAGLFYAGDGPAYDSGAGQIDPSKARFLTGHFTRTGGVEQVAMIYQRPSFQIKVQLFDPSPLLVYPVGGWADMWTSPAGFFDITKAKWAAADVDGDGMTDLLSMYASGDGSTRVQLLSAASHFAMRDNTSNIAIFGPGVLNWSATGLVAGDWNGDGKADAATVSDLGDGTTHVGALNNTGEASLAFQPDSWVTPPGEVQISIGCVRCWPLNGMPITAGGPSVLRRPLAVKIDNAPTARPHYGISQADMVMELLVEGFITRLAAYFHSQDPDTIGAVRSVRFSDRYTTPMVRGSLIFSGASQLMERLVREDIEAGAYVGVSPQLGQGSTFYRTNVDGKVAPHNLFTSAQALRDATNEVGGGSPVIVPRWDFLVSAQHEVTAGGFVGSVTADRMIIPYRLDARVRYEYDAASHTYARLQSANNALNYRREVDGMNGQEIAARNIVIINTDIWATDVRDDAGGAASLDMRLTGSGKASVFRDGRRQDGTWSRASYTDPFVFTNFYNQKIYLSPGQTWIHILPVDWDVPSS
jgi:DUF3048 family protein/VCBS repeat protein